MHKYYSGLIKDLKENQIFVFGSNPEGRHGAGSAKIAKDRYGAIYGKGRGIQGQSYALVTKNLTQNYLEKETNILYKRYGERSVSLEQIKSNIKDLYDYANNNKHLEFIVVYTFEGKNLNGYNGLEIFDAFNSYEIPDNIVFNDSFKIMFEMLDSEIEFRE